MGMIEKAAQMARRFVLPGEMDTLAPYGEGHINHTFRVTLKNSGEAVILQRISPVAFHEPRQVMQNVALVTGHLRKAVERRGGDTKRECLSLLPSLSGDSCEMDEENACWRAYLFIPDSVTYQRVENEAVFREAGRAFGRFQGDLADLNAGSLYETIPAFHNTPDRVRQFCSALKKDSAGRSALADSEIRFVLERATYANTLLRQAEEGRLPLRVTHNDTKLNNVLMDAKTGKALCVVDLDTVMPGLAAYDFGDAIRFGANTAPEDERDLSRVHFSEPLYQDYLEGYLQEAGSLLTRAEIDSLPIGAWMMTYECGMRFLADYLSGDVYFHIQRQDDNLARARCQFALLCDMEDKLSPNLIREETSDAK